MCDRVGHPYAYHLGLRRDFYLYPAPMNVGESRVLPGPQLMDCVHDATGLLVQLPATAAVSLWRNWQSGFSLGLLSHENLWFDAIFELAWQRHFGHPLHADRYSLGGASIKLTGDGLFPRLPGGIPFPGLESVPAQGGFPMAYYSKLTDVVRASVAAIDEILERGRSNVNNSQRRFSVALSFPGERRGFVEQVASVLANHFGRERVLYDKYHEAEFAQPNLDTHLQHLYHDESDLIVVFLCAEYNEKEWCGLEWRAIRDLIKKRQSSRIMLLRFDNAEVPGLFSTDGYAPIGQRSPQEIVELIQKRVQLPVSDLGVPRDSESSQSGADLEQFEAQWRQAVARFDEINPLKAKGYTGYRESAFFPTHFQADRFSLEQLRTAAERASVNFTGWPFLVNAPQLPGTTYAIEDGLETLIEHHVNDERLDFWQFRQSGFFCQRVLMWEEFHQRQKNARLAMHIDSLARYAAHAIDCLTRLYDHLLSDVDEVEFRLRVLGAENRQLETFDSRDLWGPYVCKIPQVTFRRVMPLSEWKRGLVDHASNATQEIFHRFNWRQPGNFRKTIEAALKRQF
jgi:hypothetical protein